MSQKKLGVIESYSQAVPPPQVKVSFEGDPGKTKQEFAEECNINTIMNRYMKTGQIDHVRKHGGSYGDVTSQDFQECMDIVIDAQNMFADLPSGVRNLCENDPAKFLD